MFQSSLPTQLGLNTPGVHSLFWPPHLDDGSPLGCLWWSLMGGKVTNMCHISRGRCEPLMVAPALCLGVLDGFRITRHFQ